MSERWRWVHRRKAHLGESSIIPRTNRSTAPQRALAGKAQSRECLSNSLDQLSWTLPCQIHVLLLKIIPSRSIIYTWALAVTGLKINLSPLASQVVHPSPGRPRWRCHPAASSPVPPRRPCQSLPCVPILRPSPPSHRQRSPRPVGNHFKDLTLPQKLNQSNQIKGGRKKKLKKIKAS